MKSALHMVKTNFAAAALAAVCLAAPAVQAEGKDTDAPKTWEEDLSACKAEVENRAPFAVEPATQSHGKETGSL